MKNKKWLIALIALVLVITVIFLIDYCGPRIKAKNTDISDYIEKEEKLYIMADNISVESIDSIAGMFVEDGTDEVLGSIMAVDFKNNDNKTLQYAKLVLSINGDDYEFEISTIPPGKTVRAMEINRKKMPASIESAELKCDVITWFFEEPGMHEDAISVVERSNGLVIENVSDKTIKAPIRICYKNISDGIYIGGITYTAILNENLKAGEAVAIPANHFDPDASKLMFLDYAS